MRCRNLLLRSVPDGSWTYVVDIIRCNLVSCYGVPRACLSAPFPGVATAFPEGKGTSFRHGLPSFRDGRRIPRAQEGSRKPLFPLLVLTRALNEVQIHVMFDSPIRRTMKRYVGHLAAVLCLLVTGCATSTSTLRSPEIASDLRVAARASSDDSLSRETRAQQLFLRGMTEARLGRHDEALELYSQALQLAPRAAAILAAAAESHSALGDDSAALFNLRRARASDSQNDFYSLQIAELHLSMGDRDSAAQLYNEILGRSPHNLDALYELARIYTVNGDLPRAVSTYERLLDEIGPDPDVQNQILQLYSRQGDVEGMERILRDMLEDQPHDPELHRMLAEIYVKQDRRQDAVDELVETLASNPGDVQTMLSLADLYRSLGRSDDAEDLMHETTDLDTMNASPLLLRAEALYERAEDDADARAAAVRITERLLDLDPQNEKGLLMLGDLRLDEEAYEEAGDLLYRVLEQNPRDPHLWMQAASAFLQAGLLERAVEVADEGLILFPGSLSLLQIAGYALMDAYDNVEAIRRFEEVARIIREDESEDASSLADFYSALGLLYTRTNDAEQSDRSYERAIAVDPDNAAALNNYAFDLAQRNGDMDKALDLAERAVEIDPDVPAYLDTLGWVLFQMGDYEGALRHIGRAAALEGASATVYAHLGDVHHALGHVNQATEAWSRALEISPGDAALIQKLSRE